MKGINLFCKTPASTAICNSTGQKSMVRHGIRDLDHQVPHVSDEQWIKRPSRSQPPSKPNCHYHQKSRKSPTTQPQLTTPPGSSRYVLNHSAIYDRDVLPSDFSSLPAFLPVDSRKGDESPAIKSSPPATPNEQVVVLKVSLHCKGCEGKVKKHISRMEGVRSFSIDFPKKKVTVIGDVTPFGVLASISKVKNAEFWPSPSSSFSASDC
ncbi:hypothetical protein AAC387_Pa07g3659 [Persea americana]